VIRCCCCSDEKTATTSPDTSLALLQTELAKAEEESEVLSTHFSSVVMVSNCQFSFI